MKLRTAVVALASALLHLCTLPALAEQNPLQASENSSAFTAAHATQKFDWDNIAKFEINPAFRTLASNSYGTSCSAISNPYPYQWCVDATTRQVYLNTQPAGGGAFAWRSAFSLNADGTLNQASIADGSISGRMLAPGAVTANLGFTPVQSVAGRAGNIILSSSDITDGTTAGRAFFAATNVAAQKGLLGYIASDIGSVPAGLLKGSAGAFATAGAGTDYLAPAGIGDALTHTSAFSGGASTTLVKVLDNLPLNVAEFGAVGDGSILNATANLNAFNSIKATGRCAFFPYTSSGYNFGTNQLVMSGGACASGENRVKLSYTGSAGFVLFNGQATQTAPAMFKDFTLDMSGATSTAGAMHFATQSAGGATSIAGVRISDIICMNAYECWGDDPDPANWTTATAYNVGTTVYNPTTNIIYKVTTKGAGNSTVQPASTVISGSTGTLADGYVWTAVNYPNFTTDIYTTNVMAILTKGRQFTSYHSRGNMLFKDIRVDETYGGQTSPITWDAGYFSDFIGLEFSRWDRVGTGGSTTYQSTANCINVNGRTTNGALNQPGFATVYILDRMLCESTSGNGPSFTNVGYLTATSIQSEFNLGNQIGMTNVTDSEIGMMKIIGGVGQTGATPSANGFTCTTCNRVNLGTLITNKNTGHGLSLTDSPNISITNFQASNNTNYAAVLGGVSGNVTINGGSIFGNGNTVTDGSSGGGNRITNLIGYSSAITPTSITVGASPATVCAANAPETLYFLQGPPASATVADARSSIVIGVTASASIPVTTNLFPHECVIVTWSTTAPTYTRVIH